jgi:Tfp pilus assembly protein PilZ
MSDKRIFTRKKRRLTCTYDVDGIKSSGFTYDLSHTGIFVCGMRMPRIGSVIEVTLEITKGEKVERVPVIGRVVRAFRVPPALAQSVPNGFAVEIGGLNEGYALFVESLRT